MLNVGKIEEGFVLDHIEAGKSMDIYKNLQLGKLDCTVAIIKNARSNKMGKKDILKVECDINQLDLDVLAFIDHNITVNVIKDGEIVDKKELVLPKTITNANTVKKKQTERSCKLKGDILTGISFFCYLFSYFTYLCLFSYPASLLFAVPVNPRHISWTSWSGCS